MSYKPVQTIRDDKPLAVLDEVSFSYDQGQTWVLDHVSLTIHQGERVAVVGANGSGKSTLALLLAGALAPDRGRIELRGQVVFDSARPWAERVDTDAYRQVREGIGMVFQNPEDQIVTTVTEDDVAFGPENQGMARPAMQASVVRSLKEVDLSGRERSDPTRMSGGQQQRVSIAGALAMDPDMLVMDEPGAMLDSSGRSRISAIMATMAEQGKTVVHITHHLDEAGTASRVIVLDQGRIIADGPPDQALPTLYRQLNTDSPASGAGRHTADWDANTSGVGLGQRTEHRHDTSDEEEPAVEAKGLSYRFGEGRRQVVDHLDLRLEKGRTLAILGPNGSGKSTLARLICALIRPTEGDLSVAGIPLTVGGNTPRRARNRRLGMLRQRVGYVMQKPEHQLFAETVAQDVAYGPSNLGFDKGDTALRVKQVLTLLGLEELSDRSPFDLSGGQQRLVALAGVLATSPKILVLDEVTAGLDPKASETIMTVLERLQGEGVTIILITHDEEEVIRLADQALLMDQGHMVSHGNVVKVLKDYHDLRAHISSSGNHEEDSGTEQIEEPASESKAKDQADGPSLIARLDPRTKMVCFLMLMVTSFFIGTGPQLILGVLVTLAIIMAARISPLKLMKSVSGLLALLVLVALLNLLVTRDGTALTRWGPLIITDRGLWAALVYTCRFGLVLLLGALLLMTTTPTQMTDAFESLLSPLGRLGVHTSEISLVLSLALRFIPTLVREMQSIREAQAARGGSIESGSPSRRARAMAAIIIPVFAAALRHADNLGQALDARSYHGGRGRTHYRVSRMQGIDYGFITLVAVYFVLLVVLIFL